MGEKKRVSSVSDTIFGVPKMKATKNPLYTDFPNLYPKQTQKDSRRSFSATQKKQILAQQDYKCARCHKKLGVAYHFHHAKSWSSGGKTIVKNGRALCANCHEEITHKERLKKTDRKRKPRSINPLF
jgi:nitrate/TMAO reductase-like tetraheme cytochrome c subunit